jgi:hypothetical protein
MRHVDQAEISDRRDEAVCAERPIQPGAQGIR